MGVRDGLVDPPLSRSGLEHASGWIKAQTERVLFWGALFLPLLYLSLLLTRIHTTQKLLLFLGLLGLHLVALIGGRSHRSGSDR